jgi:hypothetical protein
MKKSEKCKRAFHKNRNSVTLEWTDFKKIFSTAMKRVIFHLKNQEVATKTRKHTENWKKY